MEDRYKLTHTYQNDSEKHSCTIKIFSPVISNEEKKRRMKDIINTAAVYMTEVCRICIKNEK